MEGYKIEGNFLILKTRDESLRFTSAGYIEPKRNEDGSVVTDRPHERYNNKKGLPLNKHCKKKTEFTAFKMDSLPTGCGVYVWLVDGNPKLSYIGEAKNLRKRFSSGYGKISPRNCFEKGQPTNCKMNQNVLSLWRKGKLFHIYFLETEKHKEIERKLLAVYETDFNE